MSLFGLFGSDHRTYLKHGRLEEVMALIQVLGLDQYAKRSESALVGELGPSESAPSWVALAREHREFFRVLGKDGSASVTLVARYMSSRSGDEGRTIEQDVVCELVRAAVDLHGTQLQRKQVLRATWAVVAFAILPSLGTVAAALINRAK